jgi:hypothetical protein
MPIESQDIITTRPALDYKFWQIVDFSVAARDPNGSPSATAAFLPFGINAEGAREIDPLAPIKRFEIPDLYATIANGDTQIGALLEAVQWAITARAEAAGIIPAVKNKPDLVVIVAAKTQLQAQLAGLSDTEKLAWVNSLIA